MGPASLCIHAGEFIGLIGPNGAGKTTLLRSLLGLQSLQSGKLQVMAERIGYVPQRGFGSQLPVPVSVAEVVAMSGATKSEMKAVLAELELTDLRERPYQQLSGGQQQRVLLAQALARQPEVLCLDEPTTGIDEASQRAFYAVLQRLHRQGVTIIMISHDIDVVVRYVERIIFMHTTIRYDGQPQDFNIEQFLPTYFAGQHQLLHHHHGGQHA